MIIKVQFGAIHLTGDDLFERVLDFDNLESYGPIADGIDAEPFCDGLAFRDDSATELLFPMFAEVKLTPSAEERYAQWRDEWTTWLQSYMEYVDKGVLNFSRWIATAPNRSLLICT